VRALDDSGFIDGISIEDAHRRNDLSLFREFKNTTVILGSVKIASSEIESVEEIKERLGNILSILPPERLIVAPDCGLGFLPLPILRKKLKNMTQAVEEIKAELKKTEK